MGMQHMKALSVSDGHGTKLKPVVLINLSRELNA